MLEFVKAGRSFFATLPPPKTGCSPSRTQGNEYLASGPCSGCDRIKPTQTAKSRKITVRGAKRKPVFHSQRSQISVRDESAVQCPATRRDLERQALLIIGRG
jgi:hypothetical protein